MRFAQEEPGRRSEQQILHIKETGFAANWQILDAQCWKGN